MIESLSDFMTAFFSSENAAFGVVMVTFLVGFLGNFLPIIPGTVVIWAGILIHRLWIGEASVSWGFVVIASILMMVAQAADFACSWVGAKRFGATWQGALGGVLGGIFGMIFFSLPGLIIGPVVGAVVLELAQDRPLKEAGRAGMGTIVGGIVAFLVKCVISCLMIAGFFVSVYSDFF